MGKWLKHSELDTRYTVQFYSITAWKIKILKWHRGCDTVNTFTAADEIGVPPLTTAIVFLRQKIVRVIS